MNYKLMECFSETSLELQECSVKITITGLFYCRIYHTQHYVKHPGHFLNYSLSLFHIPDSKMRHLGDWAAENSNSTSTSHCHSVTEQTGACVQGTLMHDPTISVDGNRFLFTGFQPQGS